MKRLYEVRKEYGGVYVTAFHDGTLVPWKPLPISDYIRYNRDMGRGLIPFARIEDEIFRNCVLDDTLIRQMDFLKAGIVSTVAVNILQYSGPTGIDAFNNDLNMARQLVCGQSAKAINELIILLTIAFPYKPEDIYDMDYETFMSRIALAEAKLMQTGFLKEPITMQSEKKNSEKRVPFANLNPEDAKSMWESQQISSSKGKQPKEPKSRHSAIGNKKPMSHQASKNRWWNESPVLEAEAKHNINFAADNQLIDKMVLDSHELNEPKEMQEYIINQKTAQSRRKMIDDAYWIYADLIEKLEAKKKV